MEFDWDTYTESKLFSAKGSKRILLKKYSIISFRITKYLTFRQLSSKSNLNRIYIYRVRKDTLIFFGEVWNLFSAEKISSVASIIKSSMPKGIVIEKCVQTEDEEEKLRAVQKILPFDILNAYLFWKLIQLCRNKFRSLNLVEITFQNDCSREVMYRNNIPSFS